MKSKLLTYHHKNDWNSLLSQIKGADIYYTPEYYKIYEDNNEGEACCFAFQDGKNIALYPFLINPLPYGIDGFDIQGAYGYNGIISNNCSEEFKKNFYQHFDLFCKQKKIIAEFTRFNPITDNHLFSENFMDVIDNRKTVLLDLKQNEDDIWLNSFSSKNRNMIRKAIKNNVQVIKKTSTESFENFRILYLSTMEELGADNYYLFSHLYFQQLSNTIKDAYIYEAYYDDMLINSILVIEYNKYAHYHLSARNKSHANLAANNLLLFKAIKEAKESGCEFFHLGGGNGNENDFLFKFKANFSKNYREFKIGKRIHNKTLYDKVIYTWNNINNDSLPSTKLLRYRN